MPRAARLVLPGLPHHVTQRGNRRQPTFFGDAPSSPPVAAAEEAFYDRCTKPMQYAAALLALTPAPDLPALLVKIGVMQEQELGELDILGRPMLEMLTKDVRLLMAGTVP